MTAYLKLSPSGAFTPCLIDGEAKTKAAQAAFVYCNDRTPKNHRAMLKAFNNAKHETLDILKQEETKHTLLMAKMDGE